MRVSCHPGDPGYTPYFSHYRVWLAGAERSNVETAGSDKRYAVQLARDEFGHPLRDKDGNQLRQPFWGDVRIERVAQEGPQEEADTLSAAVYGMIQTP
jgi:hypothetical protein